MTFSVAECIEKQLLRPVFQPIGNLSTGDVLGYEALIRGPAMTALEHPVQLFERAEREGCFVRLERAASRVCVRAFAQAQLPGKLFLNFSADAIREIDSEKEEVWDFLDSVHLANGRIVVELTEQAATGDLETLAASLRGIRDTGVQLALDDYGTGNAALNLWIKLEPDYIKIDRSIVDKVKQSAFRFEVLRSLQRLATVGQAALIAEGLETAEDLMVCRDLGIAYGQGFLLGRPRPDPIARLEDPALNGIHTNTIAVFPEAMKMAPRAFSAGKLVISAPTVQRTARNNDILDLLTQHPDLHAIAIVEDDIPIGLINRRSFVNAYALPYHREVFGKKSCVAFANMSPSIIEKGSTMEELAQLLTGQDQRYLSDGLVIVEHDRYVGLATGEDLVRAVTEVRIEAARYANPLTFLPGNIPIDAHIKRLVERGASFHACYCDLNSFKPFNDQYGYWKGDEMLKLTAAILSDACDPRTDFLGHVGGDDFLILFQSEDWEARTRTAIARFNASAQQLYSPTDFDAGGIHSEDRHGSPRFYGFVTIAVGVVSVESSLDTDSDAIATLAAAAKREAKKSPSGFYLAHSHALQLAG